MAKSKKKTISLLPHKFDELEKHISMNQEQMRQYTINSIKEAVTNKQKIVELFNFDGSQYAVVLREPAFEENLNFFMDHYLKSEGYEMCAIIKQILDTIEQNKDKVKTNYITK
jgi:DNA gyrase inhibitor GyrI